MFVRKLVLQDVSSCGFSGDSFHLEYLKDAILRPHDSLMMGVFDQNKPVCIGGLNFLESPPEIWMLSTDPLYRKQGLATKLIHALEKAALSAGFDEISLGVEVENINASRLYRKLGYVTSSFRTDQYYTDDLVEAQVEVMVKPLVLHTKTRKKSKDIQNHKGF